MFRKTVFAPIIMLIIFSLDVYGVDIVKENKAKADVIIVSNNNANLTAAVKTLQDCIFKSTKCRLSILSSITRDRNYIIVGTRYGGKNFFKYDSLDEEGFIIKTTERGIILSGKTDWGTELAVYDFLERFIKVRWLMPTESWTEIPIKKDIIINNVNIKENPLFLSRWLFPIHTDLDNDFGSWGRKNRLSYRIAMHHNLINLFDADEIRKKHPNFLPTINKQRYLPSSNMDENWQPNFDAKGIEKYAAEKIINYFTKNTSETSYSLGINDSWNFDKKNSSNKKNHLNREDFSSSYYSWVNRTVDLVNRKYPNKKYGLLAYSFVASPPTFKLKKNIVPFITFDRLMWVDNRSKMMDVEVTKKWAEAANEIGWYDYVYSGVYIVPRIYFNHYQNYLKKAYDLGVRYYVAEFYPNWAEGPKGWVMSKLLWNPNQNVDDLLSDWYNSAVGRESAIFLKQFYEIWEFFWTKQLPSSNWWKKGNGFYLSFYDQSYLNEISPDIIEKADKLLLQAYKKASDTHVKKRIADIIEMWNFSKLNYQYFNEKQIYRKRSIKREIDKKIQKLENHPLYYSIIPYYKMPNQINY